MDRENDFTYTHVQYIAQTSREYTKNKHYPITKKTSLRGIVIEDNDGYEMTLCLNDKGELSNNDMWRLTTETTEENLKHTHIKCLHSNSDKCVTRNRIYEITNITSNGLQFKNDNGKEEATSLNTDGSIYLDFLFEWHTHKESVSKEYILYKGKTNKHFECRKLYEVLKRTPKMLIINSDSYQDYRIKINDNGNFEFSDLWQWTDTEESKEESCVEEYYAKRMIELKKVPTAIVPKTKIQENKMTILNITKPTLINGNDSTDYSDDTLIRLITEQEDAHKKLKAMETFQSSNRLKAIAKKHADNIDQLLIILDRRK
jgi:hypothetical protein